MSTLLLLLAMAASYAGFACLALAMPDHWERAGGHPALQAARRAPLRLAATSMLGAAAMLSIWRDGASFGVLLWVMLLSTGAVAVALTLTWRPQLLGCLAWRAARPAPPPSVEARA